MKKKNDKDKIFHLKYAGQKYSRHFRGNFEQFRKWFLGVAQKASVCVSCEKLILPGEKVGMANGQAVHIGCCTNHKMSGRVRYDGQIFFN